jgi:hypothetical protein
MKKLHSFLITAALAGAWSLTPAFADHHKEGEKSKDKESAEASKETDKAKETDARPDRPERRERPEGARPGGPGGPGGQQAGQGGGFAALDANSDGSVSNTEFLAVQITRANEIFARLDSDSDGSVSEDEASESSKWEFEFEIRPLPYWASAEGAPQNTIIGGASLWVMQGHDPEEYAGVAAFLNFLSTSDIQAKWHQDTGYMPITMAAYEQTGASGFYGDNPGTDIAIIQMTAKAPTPNSKGLRLGSFDQIRSIIDEELEAIWSSDKTAQEALDSAVERGNRLLRRFEQANR